jgi:hypothetical protein
LFVFEKQQGGKMKDLLTYKKLYKLFSISSLLIFMNCYQFVSVDQPDLADHNSSFEVPITINVSAHDEAGRGYFGIRLPVGWTVEDSIAYSGIHSGTCVYSSWASARMGAPAGYYWWVGQSDSVERVYDGSISLTPRIHTNNQSGTFFIDYAITCKFEEYHVKHTGLFPISVNAPMTVTVTNTNDYGPGSLREALAEVSSSGEIFFDLPDPATIILDSQLVINRNVTITSPYSGALNISGNDVTRVLFVDENLRSVNISNLKISHGYVPEYEDGGGIYCFRSNLSLKNVIISHNFADGDGGGLCYYHCFPG